MRARTPFPLCWKMPHHPFDAVTITDRSAIFIYKPNFTNLNLKLGTVEPTDIKVGSFGKGLGKGQAKQAQCDLLRSFEALPG